MLKSRMLKSLIVAAGLAGLAATGASAASLRVQIACAADYYAYCSQHPEDSPAVRRCMSANGQKLSWGCINALVAAGEVSKAEVERRKVSGQ